VLTGSSSTAFGTSTCSFSSVGQITLGLVQPCLGCIGGQAFLPCTPAVAAEEAVLRSGLTCCSAGVSCRRASYIENNTCYVYSLPSLNIPSPTLASISLSQLRSVDAGFLVGSYSPLSTGTVSISVPQLTTVGWIRVLGLTDLTTVDFSSFQQSSGDFEFASNAALSALSFPALTNVGGQIGNFAVYKNNVLSSLSAPTLATVNGNFTVNNCPALSSLSIPALMIVAQSVEVSNNNNLGYLLFSVLSSAQQVQLLSNPLLVTVDFPRFATVSFPFPTV
jgi:hypothetical protein